MAGSELGLLFQQRFLAARRLRGMPWAELEQQLTAAPQRSQSSLLSDILHQTVLHPLCVRFPPPASYRRRFLTELIKKHESTAADPLDELYDALAPILNEEESTRCYKSYLLPSFPGCSTAVSCSTVPVLTSLSPTCDLQPSGEAVTLSESVAIISQGTTGLITWDAALHLAEWAMENPKVFTNRTVLELGSGVGFTGLVICKTCNPKTYVFSDCHHAVLKQLTENIRLNGFTLEPETTNPAQGQEAEGQECQQPKLLVAELDWRSVTEQQLLALHADVVIAADVVYDPEVTLALIGVLRKFSTSRADRKPEIYVALTVRNADTYHVFQAELDKAGIRWQIIPAHSSNIFLHDTQPNVTVLQLLV
ncbi:protein-lysine N-methyltransferase EEF2KMT isoform X1 [Tympanuchus pallidicinctus]|uniref:protein-lysine N-methyltransferase EEF2KMT isoform X1 n=1 Tax=Tympanuchus pallidicinctus TaxID=109042 RepID=UPI0022872993|nr:protein-lysine N-methyltransferase EEF2KMT isoform X1 [Tympanuchus pallidicinctus]